MELFMIKTAAIIVGTSVVVGTISSVATTACIVKLVGSRNISAALGERIGEKICDFLMLDIDATRPANSKRNTYSMYNSPR
jgi:hypothetical protein